jgi:hypothetical protein
MPLPDAAADAPDAPPDAQTVYPYGAIIAKCINPLATPPSPSACSSVSGADTVIVDGDDTMHPWDTFLRFDLDTAFAGRTVVGVRLQLTATDATIAMSNNSGLVYESVPFTNTDLTVAEPAKAQAMALAPSQGAVTQLQTVEWPLPASLVTAGGSVYLELESPSTDGVDYWNRAGATPPQLFVDVQ